jgi:propionyl-CoA carboxylase alpha chain
MGIKTVAVHSDADLFSPHVLLADEAINIGAAPSSESYLRKDRIIEACLKTGAQAVHPGYGFLSENQEFVTMCESNKIKFIGPKSHAINAMGDKIQSKLIAKEAKVNVIPGYVGEVFDVPTVIKIANEIGYPVMIKASAGGGGKGMRIARNDGEAAEAFRLAKQEAMSSFGDDRLLVERFIDNPRHIEIQVLCDAHGNNLYLNERDCSIQRRNQKVVEEAPSSFSTPELRKAMGEQAVALCHRVGYESAGTCEFLVDSQRNFYFLEMNTRLQVEHPVTEYITGLDLVEWMIKIAAGQPLPMKQEEIPLKGWAIESRVYAEDATRNFMPSIGKLIKYSEPKDNEGLIRVDAGCYEGGQISIYYDPLISKLITYGETREEALAMMRNALDLYVIRGVKNNVNFLREIMTNPSFTSGDFSTKFIEKEYPNGFQGHVLTEGERKKLLALAVCLHRLKGGDVHSEPGGNLSFVTRIDKVDYPITLEENQEDDSLLFCASFDSDPDQKITIDLEYYQTHADVIYTVIDQQPFFAQVHKNTNLGFEIQFMGTVYCVDVMTPHEAQLYHYMKELVVADGHQYLKSPMAGKLVSVAVKEGDVIAFGQELAVVEAMKMQNLLRSEREGKVLKVHHIAGASISLDEIIIEFEDTKTEAKVAHK